MIAKEPLAAGGRLPDLALPAAPDGRSVPLRARGRSAPVVVQTHGAGCAECRAWLEGLAGVEDAVREWDGRAVVVVPEGLDAADRLQAASRLPYPVLADPERRLAERLGTEDAVVLVADQWGELFLVANAGTAHRLPDPSEVVEWLRFLAVRCPECEGEAL
ncbi:MAG TPA: redoxin domain-containing protein [Longimicrobiaceae bacterium]|nr:redoxin domain-containing protein [Longimicrobiaceae bacterium]